MTQEALKLALEALERFEGNKKLWPEAITAIKEALAQEQEPVAVYGYCPECGAKGVMRERRPNGNDKCANGHTYPSSTSTPPQRTWVGLDHQDKKKFSSWLDHKTDDEVFTAIDDLLREMNT